MEQEAREIIIENGKRRTAVRLICDQCGKSFLRSKKLQRQHDLDGNHKNFCSIACSMEFHKAKRPKLICAYCGKEFEYRNSKIQKTKSNVYFCSRKCKDKAQNLLSGPKFDIMRPANYNRGDGIHTYRDHALQVYPHRCEICGWDEDVDILQVHHIDANRRHNNIENLIVLCPLVISS